MSKLKESESFQFYVGNKVLDGELENGKVKICLWVCLMSG